MVDDYESSDYCSDYEETLIMEAFGYCKDLHNYDFIKILEKTSFGKIF